MDSEVSDAGRDLVYPPVLILNELHLEALESRYLVPGPRRQIRVADDQKRVVDDDDVERVQSAEALEGIHRRVERVDAVARQRHECRDMILSRARGIPVVAEE